jgi:probable rRNA maturation factor
VQNVAGDTVVPAAAKLREWARRALGNKAQGELTLRVVSTAESATLNAQYRGKKGPTNVLSFSAEVPAGVAGEVLPLGDVVICAEIVAREAREQGKSLDAHWAHMVVHGALHLQGHDHEKSKDAKVMEARERSLLAEMGFPDPYSIK